MSTTQARQPAASPVYILRGHAAQIHALHIFANNLRLISADADGWIVVWDLVLKRPVAVWKAHDGAVLEVKGFSRGGVPLPIPVDLIFCRCMIDVEECWAVFACSATLAETAANGFLAGDTVIPDLGS